MNASEVRLGCRAEKQYAVRHIIDCNNAFKIGLDGQIKKRSFNFPYGKFFSLQRLESDSKETLLVELRYWQEKMLQLPYQKKIVNAFSYYLIQHILEFFFVYYSSCFIDN